MSRSSFDGYPAAQEKFEPKEAVGASVKLVHHAHSSTLILCKLEFKGLCFKVTKIFFQESVLDRTRKNKYDF